MKIKKTTNPILEKNRNSNQKQRQKDKKQTNKKAGGTEKNNEKK